MRLRVGQLDERRAQDRQASAAIRGGDNAPAVHVSGRTGVLTSNGSAQHRGASISEAQHAGFAAKRVLSTEPGENLRRRWTWWFLRGRRTTDHPSSRRSCQRPQRCYPCRRRGRHQRTSAIRIQAQDIGREYAHWRGSTVVHCHAVATCRQHRENSRFSR